MSNEEYSVVTSITAPEPTETHEGIGGELMRDAFGLNPNIMEAKATLMTRDKDGNQSFTLIDFNREREVQIQMSTRSINSNIYDQLSNSFDKMVGQFNKAQIEDKK